MKERFFGDSYDIVKRCFVDWLAEFGDWVVHPMLTVASAEWLADFSDFLGCRMLSHDVLTSETDRNQYFVSSHQCGNLLLDPDTGLTLNRVPRAKKPFYLFGDELTSIARARRNSLTLVFDQCVARGKERLQIEQKLSALRAHGLHTFAYVSHACFILASVDGEVVGEALQAVLKKSRLPRGCFVNSTPIL